jgi:hypothetical protein
MKRTPELQLAVGRLRGTRDFDLFTAALEDHLATLTERLIMTDDERLQVAQGMCRGILSVLDIIKERR